MKFFNHVLLAVLGSISFASAANNACNANNCYRNFNGDSVTNLAKAFCSKFTTATTLTTSDFPAYATSCTHVAQVSSVCSCAYPAPRITTSAAPPSQSSCPVTCSSMISSMVSSSLYSSISCSLSSKLSLSLSSSLSSSFSSSASSSTSSWARSTTIAASVTSPLSSLATLKTSTTTFKPNREFGPRCNANNCLRAFDRGLGYASCSAYTLPGGNALTFPTYATQCGPSTASEVSSACTCLNYYGTKETSLSLATTTRSASISASTNSSMKTSTTPPPKLVCNSNNCLRALKRDGGAAGLAFCATFTTAIVTTTTGLPAFHTQCSTSVISQLSSACSCIGSQAYMTM